MDKGTEVRLVELIKKEASKIGTFSNAEYSYLKLESDLIGIIRYEVAKARSIAKYGLLGEQDVEREYIVEWDKLSKD